VELRALAIVVNLENPLSMASLFEPEETWEVFNCEMGNWTEAFLRFLVNQHSGNFSGHYGFQVPIAFRWCTGNVLTLYL